MQRDCIIKSLAMAWLLITATLGCSSRQGNGATSPPATKADAPSPANPSPEPAAKPAIVATVSDADARSALQRAAELWVTGHGDGKEFQDTLVGLSARLPQVPVMTDGQPGQWTKVRLNTLGAQLDAIRFTSPLDKPGNLLWSFGHTYSGGLAWHITPAEGQIGGFGNYWPRRNLKFDGTDIPDENMVVFQALPRSLIAAGKDYFLPFKFTDDEPHDIYVRIKVVPAHSRRLGGVDEMARELGLQVPLVFSSAASLIQRVDDLLEGRRISEAVTLVESEMAKSPPSRSTRFIYATITHEYAFQLASNGQFDAAKDLFLKSAATMRQLKQDFADFNEQEQEFYSRALYNEACSYAMSREPTKAIASLRESFQNGFREWNHLMEDKDLEPLRSLPEFKSLIEEYGSGNSAKKSAKPATGADATPQK